MRNGYGALAALFLTFSVLIGPSARAPSQGRSQAHETPKGNSNPPPTAFSTDLASSLDENCKTEKTPPCAGCGAYCPAKGLLDTIAQRFATASLKASERSERSSYSWNVPNSERAKIAFVIATLPDPVHTHLSLVFDRSVDAIVKAAQESGYYFSVATMPWNPMPALDSNDLKLRMLQQVYQGKVEEFPGLMIFRRANSDEKAPSNLFVFIVGESPTAGIHKEQFHNALRIMDDVGGNAGQTTVGDSLRILGTSFSGSLGSLEEILKADEIAKKFKHIVVRSGNTTDWAATTQFANFLSQWRKEDPQSGFFSFQESDDFAIQRLVDFLVANQHHGRDLAILSEDETIYGGESPSEDKAAELSARGRAGSHGHGPVHPPENSEYDGVFHLSFPREISQLRNAYQQDLQNQSPTDGAKAPSRTTLPLNLDSTNTDDDSVPAYARLQSPLSQESILLNIVATLRKHHTEFILLRATDSLDALFLCKFLRTAYPEGRLVTVGTDLLFQRETDDNRLHGILAISTYPLIPGIDELLEKPANASAPLHVDQAFADNYSVGQFNALLSMLAPYSSAWQKDPSTSGNNFSSLPNARYAQYAWPSLAPRSDHSTPQRRPSLWLVVLGRGGFWPVALLDSNPEDPAYQGSSSIALASGTLRPEKYGVPPLIPWVIAWCASFALLCCFSYLMACPQDRPRSEAVANFVRTPNALRNWHLFSISLFLLAAQLLFLYPSAVWAAGADGVSKLAIPPLVALVILCSGTVRGLFLRKASALAWSFAASAAGACLALLAVYVSARHADVHGEMSFTIYRYVHITSGVSPFLPLLMLVAAGLWSSWYSLSGIFLLSSRGPRLPEATDLDRTRMASDTDHLRIFFLCKEGNEYLLRVLPPFRVDWRIDVPAGFAVAAALYVLRWNPAVNVLEDNYYQWLVSGLLYICVYALLVLTFRVVIVWEEFHALLRALENLPLRRSFDLLKGFTWRPLWKLAGSTGMMNFYRLITREMETLRQVRNMNPDDSALREAAERVESSCDELCKHFLPPLRKGGAAEEPKQPTEESIKSLHKELAKATAIALTYLSARWKAEEYEEEGSGIEGSNKTDAASRIPSATTACVERFVCLFYLNYILVVLRRVQTLLMSIGGVFVLVLLSLKFYPFEPHLSLRTLVIVLFLIIMACVGFVYAQMHKDATLSRITDTRPGELGMDFYLRMGGFVAVPLLSLLAAQFPGINGFLFSWLEPALQALK